MKHKHTTTTAELRSIKNASMTIRKNIHNYNTTEITNTKEQNRSLKVLKRKLKAGMRNFYKLKINEDMSYTNNKGF